MSLPYGQYAYSQGGYAPLAPTCYIQSTITGQCATMPTGFEPTLRGLVGSANNAYNLLGGVCGLNTSNSGIPCGGGAYCSDVFFGTCVNRNALHNKNVNLSYVNYKTY